MIPVFEAGQRVIVVRQAPPVDGVYSIVRSLSTDDRRTRYIVKHETAGFERVVDEAHLELAPAKTLENSRPASSIR
jgi:hypothetical protein